MRKHALAITLASVIGVLLTALLSPTRAEVIRYRAWVYPDRTNPERVLEVSDFRVNETISDAGGVTYLWLRGLDGNFQLPFSTISQVEMTRFLGLVDGDIAQYDVKVTTRAEDTLLGKMEIRVMRGATLGVPWYHYLYQHERRRGAQPIYEDRVSTFWRIVLGDSTREPTVAAALPLPEAAKTVATVTVPSIVPPAPPGVPPEPPRSVINPMDITDEMLARMSLAELNDAMPLGDPFFDYDLSNLRPDAVETLRRNVAWLQKFPSVRVQIQGQADPRGTHEYNLRLGQRRSNATRDYLIKQGIAATRLSAISLNDSQLYCKEATESCWAINRRAHFVITAK